MTNQELKKRYNAIFPYHYLCEKVEHPRKTLLVGTYTKPLPGKSSFAYAPALDDFVNLFECEIVAVIRVKQIKSSQ